MSLRLLLVEDDPTSREFLCSVLAHSARLDTARTLAEADERCREHGYDLLLLDLALPDGAGETWLKRQRDLGNSTPAVALSADLDPKRQQHLLASGFALALAKPLSAVALLHALSPWLPARADFDDEAKALAANGGDPSILLRMRELFLAELPEQARRIAAAHAAGDQAALRGVLHQLRAGCGFVGAGRLARLVEALATDPARSERVAALLDAIESTGLAYRR